MIKTTLKNFAGNLVYFSVSALVWFVFYVTVIVDFICKTFQKEKKC
jgi:hypothetical protein